jgi:hypothetical protein
MTRVFEAQKSDHPKVGEIPNLNGGAFFQHPPTQNYRFKDQKK